MKYVYNILKLKMIRVKLNKTKKGISDYIEEEVVPRFNYVYMVIIVTDQKT